MIPALLALAAATWLLRITLLVVVPASRLPAGARAALEHLPPAVLSAIAVTDLRDTVAVDGRTALVTLGAGALIALLAWRTSRLALVSGVALALVLVIDLVPKL